MLFLNSRPFDVESGNDDFDDANDKKDHRSGIAIASVVLYFVLSGIVSLFHFPISLVSMMVPLVTVLHTLVVVRGEKSEFMWPCVLLGFLGALVKLASIILYLSLFDIFDQAPSKRGVIKPRHEDIKGHSKFVFFGILLSVEIVIVALSCCFQWHLVAFKKCPSSNRKRNLRRY